MADVSIDGEFRATVDLYAPQREFSAALYSTTVPGGLHQITIQVTSSKHNRSTGQEVWIDAFDVTAASNGVQESVAD